MPHLCRYKNKAALRLFVSPIQSLKNHVYSAEVWHCDRVCVEKCTYEVLCISVVIIYRDVANIYRDVALSEETAHPTVYHHLSQLSVIFN